MKKCILSISMYLAWVVTYATIIHIPTDYTTIQLGINSANNGDTILVDPGIYPENINYNGKNVVIASLFLTTGDTAYISTTIISGNPAATLDKAIVTFENNETPSARLIGVSLHNGEGNYRLLGAAHVFYGGGIYCYQSSPSLSHLIIKNNIAECGGGVFLYASNSSVENCLIKNNSCNSAASEAPNAGGAFAIWNCPSTILRNNKIQNNMVERAGGAIYSLNSSYMITNSLITNNQSLLMGSAFYADSWSHPNIHNCTVYGNLCNEGPGIELQSMMYCIDSAKVTINNSIFYNNQPSKLICQFNYSRNEVTVFHTDFEGGIDSIFTNNGGDNVTIHWLSGNMNVDPQLINPLLYDFHLQSSSPCINAGDTTGIAGIPLTDMDDNNRFIGTIDMGCYEFQGSPFGFNSFTTEHAVLVYPNPATDVVIFDNTTNLEENLYLTLYDVNGVIIYDQQITSGQSTSILNVSNLSNGIYFLRWTNGQYGESKKLVVVH